MESSNPVPIPIRLPQKMSQFYIIFLTLIVGVHSVSSPLPSTQLAGADCAGEIVRFSTCLPYVSSYPNNLSSSASSSCCDSISSAIESGDGFCFCYLLRQPLVLGFPVNSTRILSLTSVCAPARANPTSSVAVNSSLQLQSICDGSPALPPLQSGTIGPAFTNHNASSPAPAESGSSSRTLPRLPDVGGGVPAVKGPGSPVIANGHRRQCGFLSSIACGLILAVMMSIWLQGVTGD